MFCRHFTTTPFSFIIFRSFYYFLYHKKITTLNRGEGFELNKVEGEVGSQQQHLYRFFWMASALGKNPKLSTLGLNMSPELPPLNSWSLLAITGTNFFLKKTEENRQILTYMIAPYFSQMSAASGRAGGRALRLDGQTTMVESVSGRVTRHCQ